jgi:hypothetical protein
MVQTARMARSRTPNFRCGTSRKSYRNTENALFTGPFYYTNPCIKNVVLIDPCMGSGHIIVYMFDALMKIYAAYGYSTHESVQSIIEHNLYGLDIDDRAAQLAYFAVMMKAVQYDNRLLKRSEIPQPHVYAIKESNHLDSYAVEYFCNGDKKLTDAMRTLIDEMKDASEYGSILNITQVDFAALYARFDEIKTDISMYREVALNELLPFVQVAEVMSQKYDVVITNPPYMAISNATAKMNEYTKKYYNDGKADLFAVFMEKCRFLLKNNGMQAMITQQSWMFLASFDALRKSIIEQNIISMAHLGSRAFEEIGGEVVQTTTFVLRKVRCKKYRSIYCRLLDFAGQDVKEKAFLSGENILVKEQDAFGVIPGSPVAYWIDKSISDAYVHPLLVTIAFSDGQILTGNNNKYLRLIWEVSATKISPESDWVLHAKGGEYRRWYGNIDTVVSWSQQSRNHYRKDKIARFPKDEILFRRGITWTLVSMNPNFGVRELSSDLTFNKAAATILFDDEGKINYVIGLLNSKVAQELLKVINPTMNNNIKDILNMPYIYSETYYTEVCQLVADNIAISKTDWDSYETSWGFESNPLISANVQPQRLKNIYSDWVKKCNERFSRMKGNEERLNKIFFEIYSMSEAFDYLVEDSTVTVRKADLQREIKGLISYAVGCMLGRYSIDKTGLVYAGGEWDTSKYRLFPVDKDNIIPICDDEYFEDDVTGMFVKFVETVYGKDTLDENLRFIADALGGKGTPKEVIRNYFLNDFFADHCKMYQKCPIYWLFDSGKKNGFKALVYMHRYQPDTIARMRTDYVHEQQSRYRTAIVDLENRIAEASTSERVRLNKLLSKLQDQSEEIRKYEEKTHHLADRFIAIDLDDGVKKNYEIFKDVLSPLK